MTEEKQLTERTFSGFLFLITGSGIQVVLKIGVLAVLARLVSPKEFGIMGIAVIVIEFSKLFTQMGVGPAIVQRKELEDQHLSTGFTLSLLMGAFFAGFLLLIAPYLAAFFRMEGLTNVLRVISLVFVVDSFTLIGQALMQRGMKFKNIAAIEVLSYALGYGAVGILLGYLGYGVWALVTANLFQASLFAVLVVYFQPFPKRFRLEKKAFLDLLHFGGGMTIAKIGNFLATQGDNLVVGKMLGAGALGIYGRAYQFMVMPAGLFGTALDKALFPAMAKVQDDKDRLGKAFLTGVSFIALIAIPLSVILVLLAPEIVLILLGPKWTEVSLPFQVLACSLLFRMSYKMSDSLARATGAVYRRAWRQIIYALAVVIGSYVGHYWGLYGVACGVAVALLLNFLIMAHLSMQLANINWLELLKVHSSGINLGIISGLTGFTLVTLSRQNFNIPILNLCLTCLGIALVLFLALWYFPGYMIKSDQREFVKKIVAKRFKKVSIPKETSTQNAWINQ